MIAVRRRRPWPGDARRVRARVRRIARLRTAVLVVAAALFGAAASAAALVGFWDQAVASGRTTKTELAASRARVRSLTAANGRLQERLTAARTVSARLEQSDRRLRASARTVLAANAELVAAAADLRGQGDSLQHRAAALSRLAAGIGSDLVAVLDYLTKTSFGSLDPSYLDAQLRYLEPAVTRVRSAADALGIDAGGYAAAVDRFAGQAADYGSALRRLGVRQTGPRSTGVGR